MSAKDSNPAMGAKGRYLEAMQRADARDVASAVKKDRAQKRAQARTQAASAPAQPVPFLQPTDHTSAAPNAPVESQRSAGEAAQEGGEESQTKPRVCICHGDRPVEMHSLCRASVDSLRFTRPARLPSDVVGVRRERAMEVAHKVRPAKSKYELTQSKFADPDVANFVAANVIKKGMDYAEGIVAALPELKDKPTELGPVINAAKQSPTVQAAINNSLKKKGLDQDSKEFFVDQLWKWFMSTNPSEERRQLQAARILSEAFIKVQPQSAETAVLRIDGIESGLRQMFGDNYEKVKNLKPVTTDVAVEDFEEDSEGLPS